jgi:hypothetical protein
LERKIDRGVFENAIATMKKYGVGSILSTKIYPKRESIRKSLLVYYESTEEFEKCTYIKEFFEELEREAAESKIYEDIVGATGEKFSGKAYNF